MGANGILHRALRVGNTEGGKPTGKSSSDCIYFETTSTVNGSSKMASPRPCQFAGLSHFRRRIEPAQQIPLKARVGTVIGALAMGFSFVIFFDSSPPSAEDRVTDSLLVWTWFACGQSGLTPCRVRILKKWPSPWLSPCFVFRKGG